MRAANDTVAKHARGAPVTGGPTLGSLIGNDVLNRLRDWFGVSDSERVIDDLNQSYAVIEGQGVVKEVEDATARRVLKFFKPADFRLYYGNRRITVASGKSVSSADTWLNHPRRRSYEQIGLYPDATAAPPGALNLWRGFSLAPAPGDWSLFRELIQDVICNGDTEAYRFLLRWLARLYQVPGERAETAVVLRGPEGIGKGVFARHVGNVLRNHFLYLNQAGQLTGRFNVHLEGAIVVFADEAVWGGDKQAEGFLKSLITEPTLPLEAKFQPLRYVKNVCHLIMASNEQWVAPLGPTSRRYFVLDVSPAKMRNTEFFAAVEKQMVSGGLSAMLHELLQIDLSAWNHRDVPVTDAARDQRERSQSPEVRWWGDWLYARYQQQIGKAQLYKDYGSTLLTYGASRAMSEIAFGRFLSHMLPSGWPRTTKVKDPIAEGRLNAYQLPSLGECRQAFEARTGTKPNWDDEYARQSGHNWDATQLKEPEQIPLLSGMSRMSGFSENSAEINHPSVDARGSGS